jgi:Na+-transporting NADH:ubiquinone oxidoreductase subunit NqrB
MLHQKLDPRYFQAGFQCLFLLTGIFLLGWWPDWSHYAASIIGCCSCSVVCECIRQQRWPGKFLQGALLSSLISALSLCLLLKTNLVTTSLLAAVLSIASKYVLRIGHKHLFNPSAFGIVAVLLFTNDAWLSPGQWGSGTVIAFGVLTLGTIVVTRVQKLDISLAFLFTFIGLLYWRQVFVLGWPLDHFLHSVTTGSLLLFSFFMISDPRTAPDHPVARILWAVLIAVAAFYLAAFKFQYNTSIWMLVAAAPLVPLFDRILPHGTFSWSPARITIPSLIKNRS